MPQRTDTQPARTPMPSGYITPACSARYCAYCTHRQGGPDHEQAPAPCEHDCDHTRPYIPETIR